MSQQIYEGWALITRHDDKIAFRRYNEGLGSAPILIAIKDIYYLPESWIPLEDEHMAAECLLEKGDEKLIAMFLREPVKAYRVAIKKEKWSYKDGKEKIPQLSLIEKIKKYNPKHININDRSSLAALERRVHEELSDHFIWAWKYKGKDEKNYKICQFEDAEESFRDAVKHIELSSLTKPFSRIQNWRDNFFNPYHFVRLGDSPQREPATGHLKLDEGNVSGKARLTLKALSPLALSGEETDGVWGPLTIKDYSSTMGSSLAGMVRSFHEALTDSCLRVIDQDFLPAYRDPTQAPDPEKTYVVHIRKNQDNNIVAALCRRFPHEGQEYPAIWVKAANLKSLGEISSKTRFHYNPQFGKNAAQLNRLIGEGTPEICGKPNCEKKHWRTIVSEPLYDRVINPRQEKKQKAYHLPFFHEASDNYEALTIPKKVLDNFRFAAYGSADVVKRRRPKSNDVNTRIQDANRERIGSRQEVHEQPQEGSLMWAEIDKKSKKIVRLSPSVLWRSVGKYPVRERIGKYAPCNDLELCPSCRLFGSAEERDNDAQTAASREKARVNAYRGHVRFGHATMVSGTVEKRATTLVEMGSPRPGSGQLMLDNDNLKNRQARTGEEPYRQWGARPDNGTDGPRRIRGRKRYWIATGQNRHKAKGESNDKMTSEHRLIAASAEFEVTVHFENVAPEALGALLISLDPNLLKQDNIYDLMRGSLKPDSALHHLLTRDEGFAHHLGKGKGVGLGIVQPSLNSIEVWDSNRYIETNVTPSQEPKHYVTKFVKQTFDQSPSPSRHSKIWAQVLALAAIDYVSSEKVQYPPDDDPTNKKFQFDFWKKTTGAYSGVKGYKPVIPEWKDPDSKEPWLPRPWLDEGK